MPGKSKVVVERPGRRRSSSALIPADAQPAVRRSADPAALAKLFDEWMQQDVAEQKQTFDYLRQALDEGRPAGYKLFS